MNQHIIGPFQAGLGTFTDKRADRALQRQTGNESQLPGLHCVKTYRQIKGRHQIADGRLPGAPAPPAPCRLAVGKYPCRHGFMRSGHAARFFISAVHLG